MAKTESIVHISLLMRIDSRSVAVNLIQLGFIIFSIKGNVIVIKIVSVMKDECMIRNALDRDYRGSLYACYHTLLFIGND